MYRAILRTTYVHTISIEASSKEEAMSKAISELKPLKTTSWDAETVYEVIGDEGDYANRSFSFDRRP